MNNDLISREALRKAFHKRIYYFDKSSWDEANAIIDNAPTVPMPDFKAGYKQAIIDGKTNYSRPQGEEWLDNFIKKYNENRDFQITDIRDREKLLDELRPKGEWLWVGFDSDKLKWSCNQCGRGVEIQEKFCPNCGAKMKGGEEE